MLHFFQYDKPWRAAKSNAIISTRKYNGVLRKNTRDSG